MHISPTPGKVTIWSKKNRDFRRETKMEPRKKKDQSLLWSRPRCNVLVLDSWPQLCCWSLRLPMHRILALSQPTWATPGLETLMRTFLFVLLALPFRCHFLASFIGDPCTAYTRIRSDACGSHPTLPEKAWNIPPNFPNFTTAFLRSFRFSSALKDWWSL